MRVALGTPARTIAAQLGMTDDAVNALFRGESYRRMSRAFRVPVEPAEQEAAMERMLDLVVAHRRYIEAHPVRRRAVRS